MATWVLTSDPEGEGATEANAREPADPSTESGMGGEASLRKKQEKEEEKAESAPGPKSTPPPLPTNTKRGTPRNSAVGANASRTSTKGIASGKDGKSRGRVIKRSDAEASKKKRPSQVDKKSTKSDSEQSSASGGHTQPLSFKSVAKATQSVMDQLAALYPDIQNEFEEVKENDLDNLLNQEGEVKDDRRDQSVEANPDDRGMLSWLGFNTRKGTAKGTASRASEPQMVPSTNEAAMGEDQLLNMLEAEEVRPTSLTEIDTRDRTAQPSQDFYQGLQDEMAEDTKPKLSDFTVECGLGTGGFAAVALVSNNKENGKICK